MEAPQALVVERATAGSVGPAATLMATARIPMRGDRIHTHPRNHLLDVKQLDMAVVVLASAVQVTVEEVQALQALAVLRAQQAVRAFDPVARALLEVQEVHQVLAGLDTARRRQPHIALPAAVIS